MKIDADGHGFLHLFVASVSQLDSASKVHVRCTAEDASISETDFDLRQGLDPAYKLQAAQPLPGDTIRPALMGDPLAPTQAELFHAGYPLRPDPTKAPDAYAEWLARVSKPMTLRMPHGIYHPDILNLFPINDNQHSGVVLTTGAPYAAVESSWVVPSLVRNCVTAETSTWPGLDSGGDVLQGGVTEVSQVIGHTLFGCNEIWWFYTWTEWFPNGTHTTSIPANPGDTFHVDVFIGDSSGNVTLSGTVGWINIENVTQGISTWFQEPQPAGFPFTGNAASWIVERPGIPPTNLSDFGSFVMGDCWAWDINFNLHTWNTDTGFLDSILNTSTGHQLDTAATGPGTYDVSFQFLQSF